MQDAAHLIERFKALALRHGLSLGVMASTAPGDFALLLAAAGCMFAPDDRLAEREVNERLKVWLGGAGAMLAIDHVELRRWLVDNAVLARDGYGRVYTRGTPRAEIEHAIGALAIHDLAALANKARGDEAARRQARKAQWAESHQ
jgi:hypothetical protein